MEVADDRQHLGGQAEASEYVPQQVPVHGVVSLGEVDETREDRGTLLPRQLVESLDHEQHVERRAAWAKAALLLREDTLSLAVVAQACSDDFEQHFAGVCHEGDASEVAALHHVSLLEQDLDGRILPLLRHFPRLPYGHNDGVEVVEETLVSVQEQLDYLSREVVGPDSFTVCHSPYRFLSFA